MKRTFLFPAALLVFLLAGCGKLTPPVPDGKKALENAAAFSAIVPRYPGSPGAEKAVSFLRTRVRNAKILEFQKETPVGKLTFRNVESVLPGKSGDFLIIGAHYDSKKLDLFPDFQGANDGGSGVGALLEMMRVLSPLSGKLPLTLRFVFFDGEECFYSYAENDGLCGSRHYAETLAGSGEVKRCRGMILLDMIGDADLALELPANTDRKLAQIILRAAEKEGVRASLTDRAILDDHVPFQKLGIPCADLIDFTYGPDNVYWHTDLDTADKLSAESLEKVMKIALEAVFSFF